MKVAALLPAGYAVLVADENEVDAFEAELKKLDHIGPDNAKAEIERIAKELGFGEFIEHVDLKVNWKPMVLQAS